MSDHRNLATFHADFPDDARRTAGGDLLVPGGRAVADALRTVLQKKECAVTPVSQQGTGGWTFDATLDNLTIRSVLEARDLQAGVSQDAADWRLISTIKSTLPQLRFADDRQAFQWYLYLVHDALATDGRFFQIRWYTQADYEAGKTDEWFHVP